MKKIVVSVSPGICGFPCQVIATRTSKRAVAVEITGSECEMINELAAGVTKITIRDLFTPHSKNLIFKHTEQAHCHLCCPVPIAIIKSSEVALELALPQDVQIHFK